MDRIIKTFLVIACIALCAVLVKASRQEPMAQARPAPIAKTSAPAPTSIALGADGIFYVIDGHILSAWTLDKQGTVVKRPDGSTIVTGKLASGRLRLIDSKVLP